MKKLIIITDLDGTLLDSSTYSFAAAREALNLVKERDIPLIICSSKTGTEIEYYRRLLHNKEPFISENGGGIFIPEEERDLTAYLPGATLQSNDRYRIIPLGIRYAELRKGIESLRNIGYSVRGFGDMDPKEIAGLTGLSLEEAAMAKKRDFDEPFLFYGRNTDIPSLVLAAQELGFKITQGRFYHLLGNNDKGKSVSFLLDLYRKKTGALYSVAVGDSPNDLPMLERVDAPVIVQKADGTYDPALTHNITGAIMAVGVGPIGWNDAIPKIIKKFADGPLKGI